MKPEMNEQEIDALVERVTRALDVPEPSPLFWERFPDRVRAATRAEAPVPAAPWWRRHLVTLSLSGALCAALAVWAVVPRSAPTPVPAAEERAQTTDDAAWSVVTASAESAGVEALRDAGFSLRPGGADAVIDELTQAERAAFAALLEAEMQGTGPDGL